MEFVHSDDVKRVNESIQKAIACEAPIDLVYRILRKNTLEIRVIHTLGEVVCDETGKPIKLKEQMKVFWQI